VGIIEMNHRHSAILELVNKERRVMVSELAEHTGVSEVTIRQDLNQLESQGFLKRVHGAALSTQNDDISARMEVSFDTKQKLANSAANLVLSGETILIEGGSANALLARSLSNRKDITIITPSAYIAHLLRNTEANVILLGGVYQHQGESLVGPLTKLCIQHTHFSTAFIGIDGYHRDTGFTSKDMMRAEVVSEILAKSKRNIVLTDASKFGQIYSTSLGSLEQFSVLITDKEAPTSDINLLKSKGIETILV
jgi:DeoR/GlpR family transcriptional regulator of sugar metabolism